MAKHLFKTLGYIMAVVLVCLPLFLFLGYLPIRLYDESRLVVSAMEMAETGNWLVTTFEHQPDLWSTKPPLMIWLQTICLKLFGLHEWVFRLPSALAALATCLLLFAFSRRWLNAPWAGVMAALVMVGTQGYVSIHGSRTGDYDALLVLFTTTAALSWFAYAEKGRNKHLWLFFVALTLAALTKGVAALLFLPGVAVFTVYRGKLLSTLRNRMLYGGVALFVLVIGGYYLLREQASPGYWQAVYNNELGGRFLNTLEEHRHPFGYYFKAMLRYKFSFGVPMAVLSLALIGFVQVALHRRLIVYLSLVSLLFLLVISSSQTKLEWYDMPAYPLLALQIAVFIYDALYLRYVVDAPSQKPWMKWLFLLVWAIYLSIPYLRVVKGLAERKEKSYEEGMYAASYYLRDEVLEGHIAPNTVWVNAEYAPHTLFYLALAKERGWVITRKNIGEIAPGDRVITNGPEIVSQLNPAFTIKELVNKDGLAVFEVR